MRYWIGFVLFLLALGTLRVVGCGDEGPECIYPSDAVGSVRDPACDDENECTEGRCYANRCSNESAFRDGEPCDSADVPDVCSTAICLDGSCEITEKPCPVEMDERCADLQSYDCDSDTGVVKCIWRFDWSGQTCCIESKFYCDSWNCLPFCCYDHCTRMGRCSLGACVDGASAHWTCPPEYYGGADGCHCGCGVLDLDCNDGTVASCDYCVDDTCNSIGLSCPGYVDPTYNWICQI